MSATPSEFRESTVNMIEVRLFYGSLGCFIATLLAMFLIKYNPNPILLVLLPLWGLIFGVALANVIARSSEKKVKK